MTWHSVGYLLVAILIIRTPLVNAGSEADALIRNVRANGVAQVYTSEIALKNSRREDVRNFAKAIIDCQREVQQRLASKLVDDRLQAARNEVVLERAKRYVASVPVAFAPYDDSVFPERSIDRTYVEHQIFLLNQYLSDLHSYVQQEDDDSSYDSVRSLLPRLETLVLNAKAIHVELLQQSMLRPSRYLYGDEVSRRRVF